MNKNKMNNIVKSELKHIPRGPKGSPQNFLRLYFNAYRRNDLAQENPRGPNAILKEGISRERIENPDFVPNFDNNFFK